MTTTTTTGPAPDTTSVLSFAANQRAWLVAKRNAGATPAEIADELVASGWDADNAARAALSSLRSSDRCGVLYAALTTTAGVAALAAATGAHLLLDGNVDPDATAAALTVAVVTAPIAGTAAHIARRAERSSRFIEWSPERRFWFGTLATCTATVGVLRALTYVYALIAGLTGAEAAPTGADLAQVCVTVAVAVPLFIWSALEWRRSNVVISGLGDAMVPDDGAGVPGPSLR